MVPGRRRRPVRTVRRPRPGDRAGPELVFIGTGLRADALQTALAACLLAPGETVPAGDDFPAWETYGIEDACEHEQAA